MAMKSWFAFQPPSNGKAAVAIRGPVGECGVTDRDFIASAEALGKVEELTVTINSIGGDAAQGIGIFNWLRACGARIVVRVEGVCHSAASIVAMAGHEIIMPANTLMLVHNPWTIAAGNAQDLRATADQLDVFAAALVLTYCARTGKTEGEIKALLDAETLMTAAQAVELGFADVLEPVASTESVPLSLALASAVGFGDAVLAQIRAFEIKANGKAPTPPVQAAPSKPVQALAAQIEAAARTAGIADYAGVLMLNPRIATPQDVATVVGEAKEILGLGKLVNMQEVADKLIRMHADLPQARVAITNARADEADSRPTNTQRRLSFAEGGMGGLVQNVWADRRKSK